MARGRFLVILTEGLTIAVAGGVVLGIFAGLTMLITVFFHRHQYVIFNFVYYVAGFFSALAP